MKKIILFIKQLLCHHQWQYISINYYDNKHRICTDVQCKFCGKKTNFENMKKIILLALIALIMAGCEETLETDYYTSEGLRVSIIDSCEYIHYSCGWGPEYTHKGNCKFCKERRQKELEELVIKLKENDYGNNYRRPR